jgi:AcrR family transcriptional regulator
MPSDTFYNLSDEKRDRFLAAAFREFALYDYDRASVSRIVAELGIAKGSIYQYFHDKRDLHAYLLSEAAARKLEFMSAAVEQDERIDFFSLHELIMTAGARFDLSHPHLSLIIYRAMQESTDPEQIAIAEELRAQSGEFLRGYLVIAAERGEVRTDVDIDLAAHVVNTLSLALEPYLRAKYGYSHLKQLVDGSRELPFTDAELQEDIREVVSIMQHGIGTDRRISA